MSKVEPRLNRTSEPSSSSISRYNNHLPKVFKLSRVLPDHLLDLGREFLEYEQVLLAARDASDCLGFGDEAELMLEDFFVVLEDFGGLVEVGVYVGMVEILDACCGEGAGEGN